MWQPIPSAPGYYARSDGAVLGKRGQALSPFVLRAAGRTGEPGQRHLAVTIAGKKRWVHRLVCEAFHGPPFGRLVRHLDGNEQNNQAVNLRWGSPEMNKVDKIFHQIMRGGFDADAMAGPDQDDENRAAA